MVREDELRPPVYEIELLPGASLAPRASEGTRRISVRSVTGLTYCRGPGAWPSDRRAIVTVDIPTYELLKADSHLSVIDLPPEEPPVAEPESGNEEPGEQTDAIVSAGTGDARGDDGTEHTAPDGAETWPLARLRAHADAIAIFGSAVRSPEFPTALEAVRSRGIEELIEATNDGVVVAGQIELACAQALGLESVKVRVHSAFASRGDEVRYIMCAAVDRRPLTLPEIGGAFRPLRERLHEDAAARARPGRPRKGDESPAEATAKAKCRDEAARLLGVGPRVARACEILFTTEGVPEELRDAVQRGAMAPTTAVEELRRKGVLPTFVWLENPNLPRAHGVAG